MGYHTMLDDVTEQDIVNAVVRAMNGGAIRTLIILPGWRVASGWTVTVRLEGGTQVSLVFFRDAESPTQITDRLMLVELRNGRQLSTRDLPTPPDDIVEMLRQVPS